MNKAYLLIGGNLGAVKTNLQRARSEISRRIGRVLAASSLYQTAAWGLEDQPDFLNQVLIIQSERSAADMLTIMLQIEQDLGRVRKIKNGPRLIDIDLLFYNDQIINSAAPDLKVPHPLLHTRNFTLYPLAELSPELVHPVLKKTIDALLKECPDSLQVTRLAQDE